MNSLAIPFTLRPFPFLKRHHQLLVLLAAGLGFTLGAPSVHATTVTQAVTFGPSYARAGHLWDFNFTSPNYPAIGDWMLLVGRVTGFQAPFADIDANQPGVEYSYRMTGSTLNGWGIWDDFEHNQGGTFVTYSGGWLEIYRDTTPDADFANVDTFADGELLLRASLGTLYLTSGSTYYPSQDCLVTFTGGTLFDRVNNHGAGTTGHNVGTFRTNRNQFPAPIAATGYFASSQSQLDIELPVPVQPTTWGGIKAQYK